MKPILPLPCSVRKLQTGVLYFSGLLTNHAVKFIESGRQDKNRMNKGLSEYFNDEIS